MMKQIRQYSITFLIAAIFIGVWVIITSFSDLLNPIIFPPAQAIILALFDKSDELILGFFSSMGLLLPALAAALVLGISGGLFFGLHQKSREILSPFFHTLSPLPPTLFIPYAIALLPTFKLASISILFIGAFWPIFLGTIQGVVLIDQQYLDNAKTLRLSSRGLLFKVILPASSPYILSGTGTALTLSFIVLMMAEMFGAQSGMGHFVQYYTDFSQYDHVLAGLIFNSFIILIMMVLFEKTKKRLLFWMNVKSESNR